MNEQDCKPITPRFKDISGKTFGRWTVLDHAGSDEKGTALWNCRCDCGTLRTVHGYRLRNGKSLSCGCLQLESATKHGMGNSAEYKTWSSIKQRCHNSKDGNYRHYGARGIQVCARWRDSFEAFFEDVGERPTPKHSIERIDNDRDYEPGNCKWATQKEQARNRRGNHSLSLNGEVHTIAEWAERMGVPRMVLTNRVGRGWTDERILTTPRRFYPQQK